MIGGRSHPADVGAPQGVPGSADAFRRTAVPNDRRLVRLARFLMSLHLRRQRLPAGSHDEQVLALIEDETETEIRREAERLDAIDAPPLMAHDVTASGRNTAN
jgi:predicted secreted protein